MKLRAPNQPTGEKHQDPADNHLKRRLEKWRVHVAMADVTDGAELDGHDDDRDTDGQAEIRDEEGQGVAKASGGGHQAGHRATNPRGPASSERAIVGERLREAHGYAGADAGGHAD